MNSVSTPAKIILFGEHAVVYGYPAMAVPVSALRTTATITPGTHFEIIAEDTGEVIPSHQIQLALDNALAAMAHTTLKWLNRPAPPVTIRLRSDIPPAAGLGSGASVSAALGRAIAQALNTPLENSALNQLVYNIEKMYHGTPSGIDNTVIVYEQPVYFIRDQQPEPFNIRSPLTLVIANTGQQSLTKIAVGDVRRLYEDDPSYTKPILSGIGALVDHAKAALAEGDLVRVGALMDENHALLRRLTISSDALDQLVEAARSAGALGAKLSGGGRGGNMIALVEPSAVEQVRSALVAAGATQTFTTVVSQMDT